VSWIKPMSKSDRGESGRVYYINSMCIFISGEEWTKATPFTLNPEHGSTIEEMLKKSSEIPIPMKRELLEKRYTEQRLSNGICIKFWISEEPAPEWWNPTEAQKQAKARKEGRGFLVDQYGRSI
jgi:hypothetical protein